MGTIKTHKNNYFLTEKSIFQDLKKMPLPPALAARLAKRGIISKKTAQNPNPVKPTEEEVFAENYDDQEENTKSIPNKNLITNSEAIEKIKFMGYPCCPNKWNVYHECSLFCQNNWSSRSKNTGPEIDSEYFEIHKKTMEKYGPLPEDWQEKWDPGTGRHFYWCTRTDKVSWLPPGHPKAKITEAATHVREMIQNQIHMEPDNSDDSEDDDDDDEHAMDLDSDMESDHEEEERRKFEKLRRKEEKRKENTKKIKFRESGTVDPMDPASYSDCPRGSWSSGLEAER